MSSIAENLARIQTELPPTTKLIVVSKYREIHEIKEAYDAGQRHFAENRVQALLERKEQLPSDIKWHLIGHLQTNKVKYIADFIHCIHSVDSLKLAKEINKQAAKFNRRISVLLQTHIAQEESKFGIPPGHFQSFFQELAQLDLKHLSIDGIMGMATFTENKTLINSEFELIRELQREVISNKLNGGHPFKECSIGMSGDYLIAITHGSTMVRIGSAIFKTD